MNGLQGYASVEDANTTSGLGKPIKIRVELQQQIKYFEEQLEVKRQLLKLLDANPAIEQFMDLSRR
jgi:hypothetical protein